MPLLDLPDDVLYYVRDFLRPNLEDHIRFSQVCKRLREGYTEQYWRLCLFDFGAGRPLVNRGGRTPTWHRLAVMMVEHGHSCPRAHCRETLQIDESKRPTPINLHPAVTETNLFRFHPAHLMVHGGRLSKPAANRGPEPEMALSYGIDFARVLQAHLPYPTWPRRLGDIIPQRYAPLCYHPNASCVFATSPICRRMTVSFVIDEEDVVIDIENETGVTLLDLSRALANALLADPTEQTYSTVMRTYGPSNAVSAYDRYGLRNLGFMHDHEWPLVELLDSEDEEDIWESSPVDC